MAITEYYEISEDNRKFDNVMDAVEAAGFASIERGHTKVKVIRAVLYTHSDTPKKSSLTVVQIPQDISKAMLENPLTPIRSNTLPGFKPCIDCGRD